MFRLLRLMLEGEPAANADPVSGKVTDPPSGGGGGGGDPAGDAKISMTQAELDALVGARAGRAGTTALEKLAKDSGFDNVEAMQAAAKAHTESVAAGQTELEKATAAAAAATAAQATTAAQLQAERIRTAFTLEAVKANIPSDRLSDALALADLSTITVAEDGAVSGTADAVKALVDGKPWLTGAAGGGAFGTGANGGARGDGKPAATLTEAERTMAKNFGNDPDRVAESKAVRPGTEEYGTYLDSRTPKPAEAAKK